MKKKIVAALMASVMCLSMLAGCGNNDNTGQSGSGSGSGGGNSTSGSSSTPSTPVSSTPSSSSDTGQSGGGSSSSGSASWEQTWPDGQVITWLVRDDNVKDDGDTRYNHLIAIQEIEEMFHVDIQFIPFNGKDAEAETKYTAMLTTSPLPDVIGYMHNDIYKAHGGITGLYNEGICIALNDLIETKIPNLAKIFEEYPDVAKDFSNSNGEYLYLSRINPFATERDYISSTTTGLVMRKDWLDAVGMDVPTNMQEWYDVLTAFKTMDPNGNNLLDEMPFNAYSSGIQMFEAAYGMLSGIYIDPDTGKVDYGARTQKYKDYLTEMNKWYVEGLMGNAFDEKGASVKEGDDDVTGGIAGSWKGLSNNDTKFAEKMRTEGGQPGTEFVAVPWPKTADGKVYSVRPVSRLQKNTEVITTDCAKDSKKMDALAAIINYMYSDEGSLLLTWGREGDTFTVDEHGVKALTEKGNEQIEFGGSKPQYYKFYGNQSDCLPSFGNFDVDSATRDAWYNESATVWATADFSLCYPSSISLTKEQSEKISEDNTQLSTYIGEMKWKFITGQEPLSNFDTYLAELDRMGIANLVAVYQEAYDAYNAK